MSAAGWPSERLGFAALALLTLAPVVLQGLWRPLAGALHAEADSVLLAAEEPRGISARNVWRGRIASIVREIDESVLVSLDTEAGYISSRITPDALADLRLEEGAVAWAVVKSTPWR